MYVYILVFIATVTSVYFIINLLQNIVLEASDNSINIDSFKVYKNPVNRYISDKNLVQLRLFYAIITFSVVAGILILFSIAFLVWLGLAVFLGILAYMMPYWYYMLKLKGRKVEFEKSILDLSIGLTNGLKSGQALPQSLESVIKRLSGPIQEEMMVVLGEYRLGLELSESLERLYERMPCEDLQLLLTAVKLTNKTGGSLAEVLDRMTDMIRKRTEFQDKLRTMTAQGRFEAIAIASAPIITFVVLYFVDTELMRPMLVTPIGWAAIGVVAFLEVVGFIVINKIVTIEV